MKVCGISENIGISENAGIQGQLWNVLARKQKHMYANFSVGQTANVELLNVFSNNQCQSVFTYQF